MKGFRCLFLLRLLLILVVAWPDWTGPLQAQPAESDPTPALQPEEETPPAAQPPKRPRRQSTRTVHSTGNERVEMGRDVVIRQGETVGELVVIAGDATVEGTVEGSLVVVSGSARINGQVNQNLVTILGAASLGPEARVGRDVVVVGGPLRVNRGAEIGGQRTVIALGQVLPDFMWLQKWLSKGLFLARPFPPQVKWVWVIASLFLLLYLALVLAFPRPVRVCVETLEQQPVASFFIGILTFVLLGPLVFLLVVSVAGLAIIPFLFCALIAAAILGKVAVYSYAGAQVGRQLRLSDLSLPMVLLIGVILFYLIYMVPVLGFAVWGIVTLVGMGAVLLAAFGSFRHESVPAYVPARAVPGQSLPPAAAPGGPTTAPAGTAAPAATPPALTPADLALLPHVGFWRRFWATALDLILLGLIIREMGGWFLLAWVAYYVAMWAWKGTSIGGIVLRIKIVRMDGQPLDFGVALVRSLSCFFSAFALFLGFFWAGWDKEKQAWHDKIAGTVVVRIPRGVPLV